MTDQERINRLEDKIRKLEAEMAFIADRICPIPDYDKAIEALLHGDSKPLDLYLKCGGKLPESEGHHDELL